MTIAEIARKSGYHQSTIYAEIKRGHLRTTSYERGKYWVDNTIIREWLRYRLNSESPHRVKIQTKWWWNEVAASEVDNLPVDDRLGKFGS